MRKLTLSVSGMLAATLSAPVMLISAGASAQALEEITVTARKTEESLQEVPLAITALGAEEIDRLGIKDLNTVTQQDTSVQFDEGFTPSDTRITIRGLSPTRGRPNAATLVDGIDVTSEAVSNAGGSLLINPRLLDVERIEIVKGPQSALYGRSAFAGAIQYVTKDPADELSGSIYVDYNSEDAKEARGNISVPLTDTLGMLVNGLWWDARGTYKNTATNEYVGGGDGLGGSITFKWEPTDELGFKWRTEYTDDNFDVAPQALLYDQNKLYDLGNTGMLDQIMGVNNPLNGGSGLVLNSSNCTLDGNGFPTSETVGTPGTVGPLDNYGCGDGLSMMEFFSNTDPDDRDNAKDLGWSYLGGVAAPTDDTKLGRREQAWIYNQYNKQVVSVYTGKIPDADQLQVALSPNYQFGPGAQNPALAEDYSGINKRVFRTSLVADWAVADNLTLTSYSSYLDSQVDEALDLGKRFVDECGQDIAALYQMDDPLGVEASYAEAILSLNPDADLRKYAPCTTNVAPDGINDQPAGFVQNSQTDTTQVSQEFRGAWDITDALNFTTGLLYWQEDVDQLSLNSVTITNGPQCWAPFFGGTLFDTSQDTPVNNPEPLGTLADQCGLANLPAAFWMRDTLNGRKLQADLIGDDVTKRKVNHYSWYGSLDFDITERLSARVEARFTREDNEVTGVVQNPCLDPTQSIDDGCATGAGGRATGPSAVLICGQVGRCDRLGVLTGMTAEQAGKYPQTVFQAGTDSTWPWGFIPMFGNPATLDRTDRFWAPKATFEYFLTDDVLTYFSWSRGIKPGGFSLLTSGAFGLDANLDGVYDEIEFDPERLDVWEIGAKTTLFDGRLRLNGAAYYQDFKDKQVTVQAVVGNTVGTKVENISGSEITGIELDATLQITENLVGSIGYTFLDSEYTDYTIITQSGNDVARIALGNPNGDGGVNNTCQIAQIDGTDGTSSSDFGCLMTFNGNELERVPKHAANVNLNYTNALFDTGLEWYTEAQWRYQDSRYLEAFNIVEFPAYSLTDWRAGILGESYDITFFVNNVFDDDTVTTGGPNPGIPTSSFGFGFSPGTRGFPGVNAGPKLPSDVYAQLPNPRTAGVRATFRFE